MKFKYTLYGLLLFLITIWIVAIAYPNSNLTIIACDVGQGDGILIQYKTDQIVIDGGKPNGKMINCLSKYMPFWDRTIEIVISTHPQLDHYGGLIEVFKRYSVNTFLANSLDSDSQEYRVLKNLVGGSKVRIVNPVHGQKVRIGLISLDILNPTKEFLASNQKEIVSSPLQNRNDTPNVLGSTASEVDPNDFSIVTLLHFGNFEALFTGDISPKVSDEIASKLKGKGKIEYLKVPHHGSKNGLSKGLLDAVEPQIAVISAGKDNSYGHPHEEVLKLLRDKGITIFRTDQTGDIIFDLGGL